MKSFLSFLVLTIITRTLTAADTDYVFYGNYTFDGKTRVNLLPPIRNQNQPKACDASWAFAATSTMSTLFNLQRKGVFPEIVLSPQMLINCAPDSIKFSCNYNSPLVDMEKVFQALNTVGVTDETCNNYHASDEKNCSDLNQCMDCHNGEDIHKKPICTPVSHRVYKLSKYAAITSKETDPAKKIADLSAQVIASLKNGPLVCKIIHSEKLFSHRISKPEAYQDDKSTKQDYATWVSLVGYGATASSKQTLFSAQHSFGENVGYYGLVFFTADGKSNPSGILDNCYTIEVDKEPTLVQKSYSSFAKLILTDKGVKQTRHYDKSYLNQGLKLAFISKPFNEGLTIPADNTPINWQNVDGVNHLTYVKNQHIPTYCGSCWAQAAASVLADRLNIQRIKSSKVFPKYNLSVQAIINCKEGGSCFGGDSTMLFQRAQSWKVPVETCQTYQAVNPSDYECPIENVCSNTSRDKTYLFQKYTGVKVTDWGRVRGSVAIKAALVDGPVVCDFQVTDEFVDYKKKPNELNIWTKQLDFIAINHAVSVVGWGKRDQDEYWIVRNSWGREWGYDGFFYIKAGDNLLGIESECSWAKVVLENYE